MNTSLTDEQLQRLRMALKGQFTALCEDIGSELDEADKARFQQIAGEVHDRGDESIADRLTDLNLTLLDKHVQETRDITAALARMDQGNYGTCEDCNNPIGFERLSAYPSATRCIHCQEAHE